MIDLKTFEYMDKTDRFKHTQFVVEATDLEKQYIFNELSKMERVDNTVTDIARGFISEVGKFGGYPICVSFTWSFINDIPVMFYYPTSNIVNWDIINSYLISNCNPHLDGRRSHCDAVNYIHMVQDIFKLNLNNCQS